MQLEPEEARVIGSLVEKQLTTPDQYPLTLNALVAACNQSSNRDPVVSYPQSTVEVTLTTLKDKGLVRWVYPSHGRSVTRYRQVLDEVTGMDARQLSLVAVLLLRGPQTVGELRARTDRMASFESADEVEHELEVLARGDEPFVERLPQRPGQREARYTQLLAEHPVHPVPDEPSERVGHAPALTERVAALEDQVIALRQDLDSLLGQ
ncbi:MAG TPA: YceH family protein [Acidimicrobiales bacterium]